MCVKHVSIICGIWREFTRTRLREICLSGALEKWADCNENSRELDVIVEWLARVKS